jgi:hypothetical protein
MKGFIIIVIVVLAGYAGVKGIEMFKTYCDFGDRVEYHLNFVDETSMDSVKQNIVADAKKFGIEVVPSNIHILYEDTDRRTLAQGIVGSKLGAQFVNKSITIDVTYIDHILGIPFHQDVLRTKIKSVQAPRMEPSNEMKQLLDVAPQ